MVAMVKPYRHPKTGIFWLRKGIPEKLRVHFGGKREFKVTLRTREPKEAKLIANAYLVEFEHRLQEMDKEGFGSLPHADLNLSHQSVLRAAKEHTSISPPITTVGSHETLMDVFEPWRLEVKPKGKTADEYKMSLQEFNEAVGVLSLQSIRVEHVRRYKDALVTKGALAAGSINKRIGVIKTLLNFAKINGLISSNPAEGIRVKQTKAVGQRHPFTNEEIIKIFSSPVFQSNYRPKAGCEDAAYWMPILAYYTGARLEEIGQLGVKDIQEHEGIHFLEITESFDDLIKTVKTEAGKRIIPLHPHLERLGFLDYVAAQSKSGRVFSALKPNMYGSLTQNWSKWWSRYIKHTVGIQEGGKTFHAFRHTFAQMWREGGAESSIRDAIMGHSSGRNVQDRYGGWRNPKNGRTYLASPKHLLDELLKLNIPFIQY